MTDIKCLLAGIIKRDCEGPLPPDHPYWTTPEAIAARKHQDALRAARLRDDLRLVTLTESGSIKFVEVDRTGARRLIADGWVLDAATTAWAKAS